MRLRDIDAIVDVNGEVWVAGVMRAWFSNQFELDELRTKNNYTPVKDLIVDSIVLALPSVIVLLIEGKLYRFTRRTKHSYDWSIQRIVSHAKSDHNPNLLFLGEEGIVYLASMIDLIAGVSFIDIIARNIEYVDYIEDHILTVSKTGLVKWNDNEHRLPSPIRLYSNDIAVLENNDLVILSTMNKIEHNLGHIISLARVHHRVMALDNRRILFKVGNGHHPIEESIIPERLLAIKDCIYIEDVDGVLHNLTDRYCRGQPIDIPRIELPFLISGHIGKIKSATG